MMRVRGVVGEVVVTCALSMFMAWTGGQMASYITCICTVGQFFGHT